MKTTLCTRRDWLKCNAAFGAVAAAVGWTPSVARARGDLQGDVLDIGNRNQVFIDGRYLEQKQNVRIVVCPPKKTNDKCLVGNLRGYETILPVDGVFRGFHALTKDGTNWRRVKPGDEPGGDDLLGLYNGKPIIFVDPAAPPQERYKRFQASSIAVSGDGAQWRTLHKKMFPGKAYFPGGMDSQSRTPPYLLWPNGKPRNGTKLTPEQKADFDDGWIAICLAVLRLDGFVSLTAGDEVGRLITKPFVATGSQLLLNVNVHESGEVRVEVLGEDNKAIRGFELSSSVPLRGADVNQVVQWRGKADWARLAGKTVSLRIQLRNADLYALWTEEEPR